MLLVGESTRSAKAADHMHHTPVDKMPGRGCASRIRLLAETMRHKPSFVKLALLEISVPTPLASRIASLRLDPRDWHNSDLRPMWVVAWSDSTRETAETDLTQFSAAGICQGLLAWEWPGRH